MGILVYVYHMYFKFLKLLKAWTNDLGLVPKYVSLGRLYYFFFGLVFSFRFFSLRWITWFCTKQLRNSVTLNTSTTAEIFTWSRGGVLVARRIFGAASRKLCDPTIIIY